MKTSVTFFLGVVVLALAVPVAKFNDSLSASLLLEERSIEGLEFFYNTPTAPERVEAQVEKRSPAVAGIDLIYNTPTALERVGTQAEKRSPAGAGASSGNNHNEVDPNEPDDNNDAEDHNTDTNEAAKE